MRTLKYEFKYDTCFMCEGDGKLSQHSLKKLDPHMIDRFLDICYACSGTGKLIEITSVEKVDVVKQ